MLKLEVSKSEPLEINGEKYEVYKNSFQILEMLDEIKAMPADNYLTVANELIGKIDDILGAGAFNKISGGASVSYYDLGVWFNAICQTILTAEADKMNKVKAAADKLIKKKYE